MSNVLKASHSSAVHKRVKRGHPSRHSHNRHRPTVNTILPPPPPPVDPHYSGPPIQFNFPSNSEMSRKRVKWPPVKSEPLHAPTRIEPGSLGSAQQPIVIDVPPSLEDIKRETLPSTARSNYVRHSEMTEQQAKERRRQQNRASARRTRQKTRHHITVLEARYQDLRDKYTKLRSLYLNVAGPNAHKTLPTFQDYLAEMDTSMSGSDERIHESDAAQWGEEQNQESKKQKQLRKKVRNMTNALSEKDAEIDELKGRLNTLEAAMINMSCGLPRALDSRTHFGQPASSEESKPNVNRMVSTPPMMPTPPGVLPDLNVSPVKLADGDVDMTTPDEKMDVQRILPRLEIGGEAGAGSSGPNDGNLGGPPMAQFDFMHHPPQMYMPSAGFDTTMNFFGGFGVGSGHYVSSMPSFAPDGFHGAGMPSFDSAFGNVSFDANNMSQFGRRQ